MASSGLRGSYATSLCIENKTGYSLRCTVSDIDNSDWDGVSRPDHNFNDVVIAPGQARKQREEINSVNKSAFFKMTLTAVENPALSCSFRANQYDAKIKPAKMRVGFGANLADWPDNAKFLRETFYVQDVYSPSSLDDKFKDVLETLDKSQAELIAAGDRSRLFVNYVSATGVLESIRGIADILNSQVQSILLGSGSSRRFLGVMVFDFCTPQLARTVFQFNDGCPDGSSLDPCRWMSTVSDHQRVAALSVPGTHDSGTSKGATGVDKAANPWVKAQSASIQEQLEFGVRYLDIRCRHVDDSFAIHHGPYYVQLSFADVLKDCREFLQSNPSETILMLIKREHDESGCTRSFAATFLDKYRDQCPWVEPIADLRSLTLKEARGKVIPLIRESSLTWYPVDGEAKGRWVVRQDAGNGVNQYTILNL